MPNSEEKIFDIRPPELSAQDGVLEQQQLPQAPPKPKQQTQYRLFIFFGAAISYFELVYRLWIFKAISVDYIFPVLFSFAAAAVIFLILTLFPKRAKKIIAFLITFLLAFIYVAELVYYDIFHVPLSIYSFIGAKDALEFWGIALSVIIKNGLVISLLFLPLALLILFRKKISFSRARPVVIGGVLIFGILSYAFFVMGLHIVNSGNFSQYALYYKIASPQLSIRKLGVLTTVQLDIKRLIFGFEENDGAQTAGATQPTQPQTISPKTHNVLNINFENLIANEKNSILADMHKYFSSIMPTKKNEYTGMFKGKNLIFFVAESFSPYAVSPELTPTLYKMSKQGFVFNNFYNPVWEVSTSDGEYVSDVGLIPKSGVWSMLKSSNNYLPFTLGNQFKKLDYLVNAYHDHTYTYYSRNISIPNLGYNYKGVGSGVNVKNTWPESDLEMVNVTADEYINSQPFHVYYITVSGHMNYNFYGNYIAAKNKALTDSLPYSETSKAYIAGNLELEFAVKSLIDKLSAANALDNTVIAIVPDHYPNGLPKESIDELAGHEVGENFELYKSIFILWKNGMKPVFVDKPVSNLDILPTLSNLFGLEYDSRLIMGRDIFSDASPLVIFLNRSWITDKARYNSTSPTNDSGQRDIEYEKIINAIVADKFKYSKKILETDYYAKVLPK